MTEIMITIETCSSREMKPGSHEVEVLPFPKIMILYSDLSAGQQAIRMLAGIFDQPQDRLELVPKFWRFDFLEDPDWFALALADGTDAEVIVVATSATDGPNLCLDRWIHSCLSRKRPGSTAVVALGCPEAGLGGRRHAQFQFLREVTRMARLDFFAPQDRPQIRMLDSEAVSRSPAKSNRSNRIGWQHF